jgi:hypothetical protein
MRFIYAKRMRESARRLFLAIMYTVLPLYASCQQILTSSKMLYKLLKAMTNVASYYWSLVKYARY